MATYLDKIISNHRADAMADSRKTRELLSRALDMAPCRGFADALRGSGVSIIAEIKRQSPSKGDLNPDLDPVDLARSYETSGVASISVLTDSRYFAGSLRDLESVRAAVNVPLLRKDFTVSSNDVLDARLSGADALLLIVAALSASELQEFAGLAELVGLDTLVEVHDEEELHIALDMPSSLIGVNQRNLTTFEVDYSRAASLAPLIPPHLLKVCESGITGAGKISELVELGYQGALVGEAFVTASDPKNTSRSFVMAGNAKS